MPASIDARGVGRSGTPSSVIVPCPAIVPAITPASAPCPLPDTPAMPTISPACTLSEASRSPARPCGSVTHTRSSTSSAAPGARGVRAALRHLAPDHQFGQRRAVGARGRTVRDLAARPQHRDAVGDRQHLVHLVRDEDDREAVRHQPAQHHEQAFDLLRGEHRGRLVEHQDARAAIEHFEDFEPLLLADREARDAPVGRHVETAVGHQRREPLARATKIEPQRAERPGAEHDVLQHGQAFGEREMLMHHADAGIERGLRRAGRERRESAVGARDVDRPLVGHVVAEQDVHQRGLAGAVLAEQREDFAAPQRRGRSRHWRQARRSACRCRQVSGPAAGCPRTRDQDDILRYEDFGSASLMLTRNMPSVISFSFSLTSFTTSAGTSFSSITRLAPLCAMKLNGP